MNRPWQAAALRIALQYALFALVWIGGSDFLASLMPGASARLTAVSMGKGFLFVLVTSLLLYLLLRRLLRTEQEARSRAEAAARQLNELHTIAEHGNELFYKHDLDNHFTYVSPQYQTILGYEPADLRLRWTDILTDNPINQTARERTERAIQTGQRQPPYLVEIRKKNGTPVLLEIDESPLKGGNGQVEAIVGAARDVTEREMAQQTLREREEESRRAQEALQESEEKLRTLYHSMNEGLALHELVRDSTGKPVDYRILDVNPAFESITGLARGRVVGGLASAVYGAGQPLYLEIYAPVAESGRPTVFETHFSALDKYLTVSVFSPCKGQFATVFTDISKRKEAERQICLLNQVYSLISHINEAIVRISERETLFREACRIVTEHGQFRMAWIGLVEETSQRLRPVARAGNEEGYLEANLGPGGSSGQAPGPTERAVAEGQVVICDDVATDPQMGRWREGAMARGYGSCIALPLKVGHKLIGALSVYAAEPNFFTALVTESLIEVAADLSFALELFERNQQREAEQQQLRLQHSALEAAANAIVITDRQGAIQWVNDAFTRLSGYGRGEVIGKNPRLLKSGVHNADFYRVMWQTVLAGSVWQGAMTNKRKDGTVYDEEMTITPVRSAAGEITHFIAIKQDVTERRKLEQQFLRAQRMQSIGLLAGGVAHDLNNVLAPVLMALPLLRNHQPPEQRDHILETLQRSVQRGANIVQQVLTFARGVEVQRALVQLRHLVREVAKIAEETFPRDIDIRFSVPTNLWPLLGDPTQIHQVLLNLAVNARDAMPEGGQLSLTARNIELAEPLQFMDFEIPPGRYVSVSVADTGTGIAPDNLERIFEPFFTTKPAGKGTGLGLSTVLGIVKSHGGLVEVQTKVGTGSTFTVYLPAAPVDATPAATPQAAALPQGRGETILVVDDEAGIVQVARSILVANGYKVIAAKDGMQALARYAGSGNSIHAVLTDLMMPFMDGLVLTRALRQMNPAVPVVAMTGLMNPPGEEDRAAQLRELGVKHFLAKPFQAEELLRALHEALRKT